MHLVTRYIRQQMSFASFRIPIFSQVRHDTVVDAVICVALGVGCLLYRSIWNWGFGWGDFPDVLRYMEAGSELLHGHAMQTSASMPGYPLFIGLLGHTNVIYAQWLLHAVITATIYCMGAHVLKSRAVGLFSAILAATMPTVIFSSNLRLTETLFTAMLVLGCYFAMKQRILLASLLTVLGILVRPTIDFIGPLIVALPFLMMPNLRKTVHSIVIYLLIYIVMMSPWWVHNYEKYGRFVRLMPSGGAQMLVENNKTWENTRHPTEVLNGSQQFWTDLYAPFSQFKDPVDADRAMGQAAIRYIVENPYAFVSESFDRFHRYFETSYDLGNRFPDAIFSIFMSFVYLFVLLFLFRMNSWEVFALAPLLLVVLFMTAVHTAFAGWTRYREPIDPLLCLLAGAGFINYFVPRLRRFAIELRDYGKAWRSEFWPPVPWPQESAE